MTHEQILHTLQSLIGRTVTAANCRRRMISVYFRGDEQTRDAIAIDVNGGWSLLREGENVLQAGENYGFESEFESESSWRANLAQREREARVVTELVGKALLAVELSDDLKNLNLTFSDGFAVLRPAESSEWDTWSYYNRIEHYYVSVSRSRVSSSDSLSGEPVARREVVFIKDGLPLPGTITLMRPQAASADSPWDEVSTEVTIETPFERSRVKSMGVDGIQSTQLCLMVLEVELNKIAEANGATVSHLAPNNGTINPYEDELTQIHNTLGPMMNKVVHWNESLETSDMGELLKRLEGCLDRVEARRLSETTR